LVLGLRPGFGAAAALRHFSRFPDLAAVNALVG